MKDIPSARSEATFDEKAARAYWQRLSELDADIAAAERAQDATAKSVAENEKNRLLAELQAAHFGKRMKIENADQKRLRDRVCNAVRVAIRGIEPHDRRAAAHFRDAVKYGGTIRYAPAQLPDWEP